MIQGLQNSSSTEQVVKMLLPKCAEYLVNYTQALPQQLLHQLSCIIKKSKRDITQPTMENNPDLRILRNITIMTPEEAIMVVLQISQQPVKKVLNKDGYSQILQEAGRKENTQN